MDWSWLTGKSGKAEKLPAMSDEQMSALNQYLSMFSNFGMPGMQSALQYYMGLLGGSPEATQAFTAPYMREFNEQIVPQVAERFTGMGAQRSSAFGQQMGAQAAGLEERLAALRSGLGMQAAQGLMGGGSQMAQMGFGAKPFGYMMGGGSPGLLGYGAQGLGSGIGMGLPSWLKGIAGGILS